MRQGLARRPCNLSEAFLIIMPVNFIDNTVNIITKRRPLASDEVISSQHFI